MGIYIDMEMPTGNDELRLIIHSNGQVIIDKKTYWEEAEAIPVPEHGRLIDADALEPKLKFIAEAEAQIYGTASWNFVGKCRIALAEAQTVIPAEPAEEGE